MLCVEDYIQSLHWVSNLNKNEEKRLQLEKINKFETTPYQYTDDEIIFSGKAFLEKSQENFNVLHDFVRKRDWVEFLAKDRETVSSTSVCLQFPYLLVEQILTLRSILEEEEEVAWDVASYRDAPVGLRIWTGGTVDKEDLEILMEWIDFAYSKVIS